MNLFGQNHRLKKTTHQPKKLTLNFFTDHIQPEVTDFDIFWLVSHCLSSSSGHINFLSCDSIFLNSQLLDDEPSVYDITLSADIFFIGNLNDGTVSGDIINFYNLYRCNFSGFAHFDKNKKSFYPSMDCSFNLRDLKSSTLFECHST